MEVDTGEEELEEMKVRGSQPPGVSVKIIK